MKVSQTKTKNEKFYHYGYEMESHQWLEIVSQTPPRSHAYNIGENSNIFDASKFNLAHDVLKDAPWKDHLQITQTIDLEFFKTTKVDIWNNTYSHNSYDNLNFHIWLHFLFNYMHKLEIYYGSSNHIVLPN